MKHRFLRVFGFVTAILCALGAGSAAADAVGPYYATPSWDQTLPSSTRFIVLTNFNSAAVLDRETGLVWAKQPPAGPLTWDGASRSCRDSTLGGRYGWRLATYQELTSLVDVSATSGPPLPSGHPFSLPAEGGFWTATTVDQIPVQAYIFGWGIGVDINGNPFFSIIRGSQLKADSFGGGANFSILPLQAWCVRGGLQPAPQ